MDVQVHSHSVLPDGSASTVLIKTMQSGDSEHQADSPQQPTSSGFGNTRLPSDRCDMHIEANRQSTFATWPTAIPVTAKTLSRAGFFYTGEKDIVECFSCGVKIGDWRYGSKASERHRNMCPHCPFMKGTDTSNVPLTPRTPPSNPIGNTGMPGSSETGVLPVEEAPSSAPAAIEFKQNMEGVPPAKMAQPYYSQPNPVLPPLSTDDMREFQNRLSTFHSWPVDFLSPHDMAMSGFYYVGVEDRVKCAFCGVVLNNWQREDNPQVEHQRLFPTCQFVLSLNNQCSEDEPSVLPAPAPPQVGVDETGQGQHTCDYEESLGIETSSPRNRGYATPNSRLLSFNQWPGDKKQTPQQLSDAGFYYTGTNDNVKCFYCDGGLRNWEPGDEPWVEHARWFSRCPFVRMVKGSDFIQDVVHRFPPNTNSNEATAANANQSINRINIDSLLYANHVKIVIEMGFSPDLVKEVLRLNVEANNYSKCTLNTSEQVLESVLKLQDLRSPDVSGGVVGAEGGPGGQEMEQASSTTSSDPTMSARATGLSQELSLEEENRYLKEQRLCKICMDNDIGVVFLPCGHLMACVQCAPALKVCPMCRHNIKATVRTFLS